MHLVNPWDAQLTHAYPQLSQPNAAVETTACIVAIYKAAQIVKIMKVTSHGGQFQE